MEKVEPVESGCWEWIGAIDRHGYGNFNAGNRKLVRAHRWGYERLVGSIPDGLDLDHLCRVRRCVNPEHLEPVTRRENVIRGASPTTPKKRRDRCFRGHPYTPKNTYVSKTGRRVCRRCGAERAALRRQGRKMVAIQWRQAGPKPRPIVSTVERFRSKVDFSSPDGCWLWTAALITGYGSFWDGVRTVLAHRWSWEAANGAIPEGLVLDHLCRNRRCVNPDHLEPVTAPENTLRGPGSVTHCVRGHALPERDVNGSRGRCKECARIVWRAWAATEAGRAKIATNDARRQQRKRNLAVA